MPQPNRVLIAIGCALAALLAILMIFGTGSVGTIIKANSSTDIPPYSSRSSLSAKKLALT